jgi:hypothetical protein
VLIIGKDNTQDNQITYKIDYDKLYKDTENKEFYEVLKNEFTNPLIKHQYIVDRFTM